jgi:hypothetical protein
LASYRVLFFLNKSLIILFYFFSFHTQMRCHLATGVTLPLPWDVITHRSKFSIILKFCSNFTDFICLFIVDYLFVQCPVPFFTTTLYSMHPAWFASMTRHSMQLLFIWLYHNLIKFRFYNWLKILFFYDHLIFLFLYIFKRILNLSLFEIMCN